MALNPARKTAKRSRTFDIMRIATACAVIGASMFSTSAAHATNASGEELVTLTSGAVFRGALVEKIPRDHVTIKMPNGEVRRFEWADVQSSVEVETAREPQFLRRDGSPQAPSPSSSESKDQAEGGLRAGRATETSNAKPLVLTVAQADKPGAALERRIGSAQVPVVIASGSFVMAGATSADVWRHECNLPCTKSLDASTSYRVTGNLLVPSEPFALPQTQRVNVDARMGSLGAVYGGTTLIALGGLTTITGTVLGIIGFTSDDFNRKNDFDFRLGGGALAAGGIALIVGGVLWITANGVTELKVAPTPNQARVTTSGFSF